MMKRFCLTVMAVMVWSSCATAPPQRLTVRDIDLRVWQWSYEPTLIQFHVGERIRLHAVSLDVMHRVTCPEIGLDAEIPARGAEPAIVEFTVMKPGDYTAHCGDPKCGPGQSRMQLRMIVLN